MQKSLIPVWVFAILSGCQGTVTPESARPMPAIEATTRQAVGVFYIGGRVERPGAYPLTGETITLRQALSDAGPTTKATADLRVVIIRRVAHHGDYQYYMSATSIVNSSIGEIPLQPNDSVMYGCNMSATNCFGGEVHKKFLP
jgi:protein involved in polysaccharide export with SLBB domain